MRVVAIEEHHIIPEMRSRMDLSLLPPAFRARLDATAGERLADMDAAGIDVQVLSVMLPMPQMLPAETAVPLAAKINGELHTMVTAHPDRFAAFALLPVTKPVSGYFREHFWITTSGYFYDGPFRLTREMFGDDRLIFSVDYPLSDNRQARDWFDRLDLAPEVREKIAHGTVDNLLRLR